MNKIKTITEPKPVSNKPELGQIYTNKHGEYFILAVIKGIFGLVHLQDGLHQSNHAKIEDAVVSDQFTYTRVPAGTVIQLIVE